MAHHQLKILQSGDGLAHENAGNTVGAHSLTTQASLPFSSGPQPGPAPAAQRPYGAETRRKRWSSRPVTRVKGPASSMAHVSHS